MHLKLWIVVVIMIPQMAQSGMAGEPCCAESWMINRNDIVFYGGFEADSQKAIGTETWKKQWGIPFTNRIDDVQFVTGSAAFANGRSIRVSYPEGKFGPQFTGVQFPISFENIETMQQQRYDSLYIRYYVKFEPGFDFRLGGKLPGIMGCNQSWQRSGGNQPDGTNGWTLRLMWREGGKAVVYSYLPPHKYGGAQWGLDIELNRTFQTGVWHCIEQYVKINDVGKENGKLHVWLDNEQVLTLDDVVFRTVDNDAGKIGGIFISTFHGGNTPDWAPRNNSYALFDGFAAAKERRIGLFRKEGERGPSVTEQRH